MKHRDVTCCRLLFSNITYTISWKYYLTNALIRRNTKRTEEQTAHAITTRRTTTNINCKSCTQTNKQNAVNGFEKHCHFRQISYCGRYPWELKRLLSLIGYGSTGGVCGRSLTAGKILFTGRQTCSLYLVLWLCVSTNNIVLA